MKKKNIQSVALQLLYKCFWRTYLRIVTSIQFPDTQFLRAEDQFIIIANHNSHLDTLSLLASLPGNLLWKVKPVAAEDYFGRTRFQAALSNYFINTLLIRRKGEKGTEHDPVNRILEAIDEGYSLILYPEGTRGIPEKMSKIRSGIARILVQRPHIKYVPVFMTGLGRSLPKGRFIVLPFHSAIHYGKPTLAGSMEVEEILQQITDDFDSMQKKYQTVKEKKVNAAI